MTNIPQILKVANKRFNAMFKEPQGQRIWKYLCSEITIIRMIDAANLKRASVDPISSDIDVEFKLSNDQNKDKWKQYIGYMIKIIMWENGYALDSKDIRIVSQGIFIKGARYKRFTTTNNNN